MFQSCFDCYLQMLHFFIKMQATINMMLFLIVPASKKVKGEVPHK